MAKCTCEPNDYTGCICWTWVDTAFMLTPFWLILAAVVDTLLR